MSFEYLLDPSGRPSWSGVLPGAAEAYFLARGEGERAMVFDNLFTVLASADETEGQFGVFTCEGPAGDTIPAHAHDDDHEIFFVLDGKVRVFVEGRDGVRTSRVLRTGDFGFVPAGLLHAYRIEERTRMLGVSTGGFERFFQKLGTPTDHTGLDQPPFVPDLPRMKAAAAAHRMRFRPDVEWPEG